MTPAKLDVLFSVAEGGTFTAEEMCVSGSLLRAMWDQGFLTSDRDGAPIIYRISSAGKAYVDLAQAPINFTERDAPIARIQREVAQHFRIPAIEMTSDRRARSVARPRQVAMYLAKETTAKSLPAIGRRFGNRDHTTVIHAIRKVRSLMDEDPAFLLVVETLKGALLSKEALV